MARINGKDPVTTVRAAQAAPAQRPEEAPTAPADVDGFGGVSSVGATDLAGLDAQPRDVSTSPLATRFGLPAGFEGPLQAALKSVFGVDVPALKNLSLDEIDSGKLTLDFNVKSGQRHVVPFDGRKLEIEVPHNDLGVLARLEVDLTKNERDEPLISGIRFSFESLACSLVTRAPNLRKAELPKLKNPSALQAPTGFTDRVMGPMKDLLADVRIKGFEVNDEGRIHISADVDVAGMTTRDFHQLAKEQLPVLDLRLETLANQATQKERADDGKAPLPSVKQVRAWVEEFARLAYGISWKADFSTKQGDFNTYGDAELSDTAILAQNTEVNVAAPNGRSQHLSLRVKQNRSGSFRAGESPIYWDNPGVDFKMTPSGLEIDGVDVDALLPVDLKTWPGPGDAPRVGSAAFAQRLGSLLDKAAPLHGDQDVAFFRDGNDVLNERIRLCDEAGPGDVLLMQTFIFADDTTGSQVVDALIRAKARGADVRVLIDTVGSMGEASDLVEGSAAYNRLRENGVDAQLFQDPTVAMGTTLKTLRQILAKHPDLEAKLEDAGAGLVAEAATLLRKTDPQSLVANPVAALTVAPALARLVALASAEDSPLPAELLPALQTISTETDGKAILAQLIRDLGRDHRKQTVLLGEGKAEMLMGGNNIQDAYQLETDSPHYDAAQHGDLHLWNDAHARIRGAATVVQSATAFAKTWAWQSGATPPPTIKAPKDSVSPGDTKLRLIHHRPMGTAEDGDNHYTNTLIATLEGCGPGDEINIQNPYFIPQPEVLQAMLEATRRGAKLRVVTNGPYANNDAIPIAEHARRFVFPQLIESGAEVYVTRPDGDPIHRKTLVVKTAAGKSMYIMGSQNLDSMSTRINREMVIVGGNAASGGDEPMDAVARGLLDDMERDTDPKVSERAQRAVIDDDPVDRAASVYLQSVLVPVL